MWKRDCEEGLGGRRIEDVPKLQPLSYTEFEVFLPLRLSCMAYKCSAQSQVIDVIEASQSSRIFRMALGSSQTLGHQIKAWLGRCCSSLNPPTLKLAFFLWKVVLLPCCGIPFIALLILICFGETFSYSQLVDARVFFESSPKPSTQDNTLW